MKKFMRNSGIFILLLVVIMAMVYLFGSGPAEKPEELTYTAFLQAARDGNIKEVLVVDQDLVGIYNDTAVKDFPKHYDFYTYIPSAEVFYDDLAAIRGVEAEVSGDRISSLDFGFDVTQQQPQGTPWILEWLPIILVVAMMGFFFFMIMRQNQNGNNSAMNFGKSRAQLHNGDKKVTFAQVAGADEEKEELAEIVDFLKEPRRYTQLGARIPKGVLLVGPPGTGKTLLAKACAGEAGVPFFSISGSDFVEMFVGVGASRVRDLFDQAKKHAPCIVFIDEIDAVGRHRGAGMGGGHDEREQTLNQLLVEMDGFAVNEGIIVLAATNRPDILDPALLRPGRFDRQIVVNEPDVKGREAILKVHANGKPLAPEVDFKVLAKLTPGFTGADIENMLNEAAILTARSKKKVIGPQEIEQAIRRVTAGPEKKSKVVTEKDRKLVAYHEAGHAVVAYYLKNCDPVHEVSIIPHGQAGGYTLTLPREDTSYTTKGALLDRITEFMGGRAAESVVLEDITTGAYSDIQRASKIARAMVTQYGMSGKLGPVFLGGGEEIFIGRDFGQQRSYSEQLAAEVDDEVNELLNNAFAQAAEIVTQHIDKLHRVVEVLYARERIDGNVFRAIMEGTYVPEDEETQPETAAAQPAAPAEEQPAEDLSAADEADLQTDNSDTEA